MSTTNQDLLEPDEASSHPSKGNGALAVPERALQAQIDSERELARVKGMLFLAHQHPRDEVLAMRRIIQDCARLDIAEKASYAFARAGTRITGPSIRLMEVIARRWGNLDMGVAEINQSTGESVVEAWAWDLEANVADRKRFRVPHTRDKKGGVKVALTDARDIYERIANDGARRKRACIETVVPKHIIDDALTEANKTLETSKRFQVTKENVGTMLEAFENYGVTTAMIESRIQCRIEAITPRLMVQLKAVLNALDDNMTTVPEQFDILSDVNNSVAEFPDDIKGLAKQAGWPDTLLFAQYERYGDFGKLKKALETVIERTRNSSRSRARGEDFSPITDITRRALFGALGRRGITKPEDRHAWATEHKFDIAGKKGRPEPAKASFKNLSEADAQKALDLLTVKVGDEWHDRVLLARCEACGERKGAAHDKDCPLDEVDE